ncbi:pyrophosphatase PpaX [Bacillus tuaregi]|uniref:pyrophosphatase PpaX n=1 Tax=Bacillus tuaregi TaxID=1816695 RepID=UPI0008F964FE|nr:pyrophosphatase PpaX [Bacillus tuaregi]
MNNKITTLLFDLDGTLVDTNELIYTSFQYTLDQYYPGQYKREDILPFFGPSLTDTFSGINPEKAEEMIKVYQTHNKAHHDQLVSIFPGVFETVAKLKEEGYKLGVVTTKRTEVARMGLNLTKLTPFFDAFIAFEDVEKTKPDPESLFKALDILDARPEEAIMVGDNFHDILAGKNAGMKTAGVSWTIKGVDYLKSYEPDYILESMNDLMDIVEGRK